MRAQAAIYENVIFNTFGDAAANVLAPYRAANARVKHHRHTMSAWNKLLERPVPSEHFVQFYGADEASLARNVARFLLSGLLAGESAIVIAEPGHNQLFCRHMEEGGIDIELRLLRVVSFSPMRARSWQNLCATASRTRNCSKLR